MPGTEAIEGLRRAFTGEVSERALDRHIHAADASLYEQMPALVVRPRSVADVQAAVRWAAAEGMPITARGAGTSLSGQATGGGMILDLARHFTRIGRIHAERGEVTVEPGVILDDLNDHLAPTGAFFGPETSTSNRCTIGGMVANNSCGTHSPAYGSTRDHVVSLDCVLADGSTCTFRELDDRAFADKLGLDTLEGRIYREVDAIMREHRDAILAAYPGPAVTRRNTGYCLDVLAQMRPWRSDGEPCNLAPLVCGSEGTLAMVTGATLGLVDRPRHRLLIAAHFPSVIDACRASVVAVDHDCYAGELIDGTILEATKRNREQARNRFFVEGDPGAILAIEMEDGDADTVRERTEALVAALQAAGLGYHHPILEAADIGRVWDLRKAGLGLLMGVTTRRKGLPFIEDGAVAPHDLPAYVEALDEIMARHGCGCVYYAHAAAGELHPRPELDTRDPADQARLESIALEVAQTIKRFGGMISGEHGDGRVRAPFIETVLGPEMVALFKRIKAVADPSGIFNPGKIVDPEPLTKDWRIAPGTPEPEVATAFDWSASRGLLAATEQCNGAGACRKSPGRGTMCPSYHATREEAHTTRGRANLFRRLLTTTDPRAAFDSDDLAEALSLCLGCKACQSECPANVDMARLKAEFLHQRHSSRGTPRADRSFGRFARHARRARLAPGLASRIANLSLVKRLMGVDARRSIPPFAPRTARELLRGEPTAPAGEDALGEVVLVVDEFTEHLEPEIARAALRVLVGAGWRVHPLHGFDSGRSQISRGLLVEAAACLERLIDALDDHVVAGRSVVGLEPSAILGLVDEAPDLVADDFRDRAQRAAAATLTFEQFIARHGPEHRWRWRDDLPRTRILVHGHCHQKAITGTADTLTALRSIPFVTVEEIASGCCGMAGSFGYEHYEVSMAIGEQILFPAVRNTAPGTTLCAPGHSCRHQIHDGTRRQAEHPAVILERHLRGSTSASRRVSARQLQV